MQRLTDIISHDLHKIVNEYRDVTKTVTIQCGTIKKTLYASMQGDRIDFTADISAVNAFSLMLYFIDPLDPDFKSRLTKNAIIFVDGVSFKIIDENTTMGLVTLSLERKGGR